MASSSGKLGWTDRRFVTKAAEDGQDELQLAQLASQKATNPDVKSYAEQLVQQHQQVNSELMSIANQRNVKIDKEESNSRAYKRLNKASSQDFDREFVDHMIDEHEKDIKLFQKAASDAKDPQVRDFASRHVADLQQHLQMAQRLQQSVAATGEETGRSGQSYRGSSSSTSSTSSTESTTSTGTGSSSSGYGSGGSSSSVPSTSR
jgi:putative membrane protein